MYRLSLGITTKMSVETTEWIAGHADTLGVDGIWIGEDIGAGQDTTVLTASTLLHSRRVRVGTAIVPIAVHNVATIARDALTLYEIGEGRFALGIGIGGVQDLQRTGIDLQRPVTEMRETTRLLRALWSGECVTAKTELFSLDDYSLRSGDSISIPIFFGVRGPQMLDLAGRVSDGVILSGPFEYLERAIGIINKAALEEMRDPSDIETVVWTPTIHTFNGLKVNTAKRIVALVVADTPRAVESMLSVDHEKLARIRNAVASSGPKAGADFVDSEILDAFSITGSIRDMLERFEDLASIGASEIVLGPPYTGNWKESLTELINEARGNMP